MKFEIDTTKKTITLLESCNFKQFIKDIESMRPDIHDYTIEVLPPKVEYYPYVPYTPVPNPGRWWENPIITYNTTAGDISPQTNSDNK